MTTLCIYLLLVLSVIGVGAQAFKQLWLGRYLVKDAFHRRLSEVEMLEQRFAPLRPALPKYGEIGYVELLNLDDRKQHRRAMKLGYIMAPLMLKPGVGPQLVIADADTTQGVEALAEQYGLTPVVVLDNGAALLVHPSDSDLD